LAPPLVVDAPAFEDGLDGDVAHHARPIVFVALDDDGLGDVQGSKSISA
jgi:hypothetical protein